jgi:predicted dehydrogenase
MVMAKRKDVKSRFFGRNPNVNYIPTGDRYFYDVGEPKYKFNVIGTGNNGCEHIRVTMLEGRATIHGIYDPNPGSIEKAKESFKRFAPNQELVVFETLEAACFDGAVDGLIISTPNYTHIDVLKVALRSRKHIFLEKPMATTVPDAFEIVKMAKEYPLLLQIGLQYRYKAMYVEAIHEALVRKSVGDIKMIGIVEHRIPFLDKVNQWNKFSKYSGGTLVEKCCHYFDMLNMFAQSKPVKVFASGSMAVNFTTFEYGGEKSDILDNALVSVEYTNGVRASFNLCMFAPMFYEEVTVCGDEGRIKAYEMQDFLPTARPKTQMEVHLGEAKPSRICAPVYPSFIEQSGHNGATFFEHINLIDNIEGLQTDAATAEEGFWSVVVGAAAEESVKTGQPVMIDEFLKENGITEL